jgi:hypothetical protein
MSTKTKSLILKCLAVLLVPAAFAWTFVPFYKVFGWYEYAFKARFLQKAAVSLLGFGTLCLAAYLFYSGYWMAAERGLKDISGEKDQKTAD